VPELPFITVLAENLGPHLRGRTIREVFVPSPSVLKTVAPPITDLAGRQITDIRRRGKLLLFDLTGGLVMVMHLRRNGRLQVAPGRAGRTGRDTALVLALDNGTDLRMIELGPKKAASVWLFPAGEAESVPPVGGLGLEPLGTEFALPALARMLREERTTLKRFLTTQRYIVGIGNAYADEILWEARLSPQVMTPQLADGEIEGLHGAVVTTLERAVEAHRREFAGALPMKEPLDLLSVHRHGGAPCPRCGTPIAVIYYEDRETYYCPRCQTGGKVYADRRRSRLLK
jgi:formamidopyrimidine-DNA glycosylase